MESLNMAKLNLSSVRNNVPAENPPKQEVLDKPETNVRTYELPKNFFKVQWKQKPRRWLNIWSFPDGYDLICLNAE